MFVFSRIVTFCWALFLMLPSASAADQDRVALVIGNSKYHHAKALKNPYADSAAIAEKFRRLGFSVKHATDLSGQKFRSALGEFSDLAFRAKIAVVYYAGHGIEMNGQNFLIPVDAEMRTQSSAKFETIALADIVQIAEQAQEIGLVLLDACRDNPFTSSMTRANGTRSVTRGLADISLESKNGILISFAAQTGQTAADGDGKHSPYAAALLDVLDEPGLEIGRMFRTVRAKVRQTTNNQQIPVERAQLPDFAVYLVPPKAEATSDPTPAAETAAKPPIKNNTVIEATFGDWEKRCLLDEAGVTKCQLYQLLRLADGSPVAEFSLFRLPLGGEASASATIATPKETLLSAGLKMNIDGKGEKKYVFSFCSDDGCFARIGLTKQDVQRFRKGAFAKIKLVPAVAPDQIVEVSASLKGFTRGYDALEVIAE